MTKAEVKAILDEADDNGDGRLDYSEVVITDNVCGNLVGKGPARK